MKLDGQLTLQRTDGRQAIISSGPDDDQHLLITMIEPGGEVYKSGLMDMDTTIEALAEMLRIMANE